MNGWLRTRICQFVLIASIYGWLEAKPIAFSKPSILKPDILEVSIGETAKILCPSNDDNHRFQFWQLKTNQILGPGNKVDGRKYKYEVLSGTLYIKGVSLDERGIYTCYCKHLAATTYNAKSVMLVVKSDVPELLERDDRVDLFTLSANIFLVTFILMILYIIYNNVKRNRLLQYKDFIDKKNSNEIFSKKASLYSSSIPNHDGNNEIKRGIDKAAYLPPA